MYLIVILYYYYLFIFILWPVKPFEIHFMYKRCYASKSEGVLLLLKRTFLIVSLAGSQASYVNQNGEEGFNIHVNGHGQKSNDSFLYCNSG